MAQGIDSPRDEGEQRGAGTLVAVNHLEWPSASARWRGGTGGLMSVTTPGRLTVEGQVSRGFEAVREAFAGNFERRHELGGACCVYLDGEKVVDLWGGIRNKKTGEPWERDTMVVVHSATKGLAAMTLAIAHSRGWLDYEEPVAMYWPEFAQNGKETITVRQLLAHQAGLFAFDEPVDRSVVADLARLAAVMARHKPAWEPGTRQAYHGLTLGFYEGELMRRVDPRHRTLGQFFQDEIATRLGEDFYIRLPENISNVRLATLSPPGMTKMLIGFRPVRLLVEGLNPRSNISRALAVNPGTSVYLDASRVYARNLEVPAGGGVGTARAIAHAYSVFATGGRELGLRKETLDLLAAPAVPPTRGFYDECLKGEVQFSLGFMKPCANWRFGSARSFGSPGTGGALGFADPDVGIGYAYVTSRMGTVFTGDPRDVALRDALYMALRSRRHQRLVPVRIAS
ncbi:MAG TPA: serine hydrolase domain-containing protein [Vicinamibacteria bacterium]|nr:serine hydrolase domain-containing protein [Vicinamibacteria bacterium]